MYKNLVHMCRIYRILTLPTPALEPLPIASAADLLTFDLTMILDFLILEFLISTPPTVAVEFLPIASAADSLTFDLTIIFESLISVFAKEAVANKESAKARTVNVVFMIFPK